MKMTEAEYAELMKRRGPIDPPIGCMTITRSPAPTRSTQSKPDAKSRSKYGNHKVLIDGATFDSKKEYARWKQLLLMEVSGQITELKRQVKFILVPSVIIDGRKRPDMKFTADFTYKVDGVFIVEDCKSAGTAGETAFKMRRHLLKHVHGLDMLLS